MITRECIEAIEDHKEIDDTEMLEEVRKELTNPPYSLDGFTSDETNALLNWLDGSDEMEVVGDPTKRMRYA